MHGIAGTGLGLGAGVLTPSILVRGCGKVEWRKAGVVGA